MISNNAREVIKKILLPLYRKLIHHEYRKDTVEILGKTFRFNPVEEYLDFGETRPASREYIENELKWYLSQDRRIFGYKGIETNPIWKKCATRDGFVNSNYGHLVFQKDPITNQSQFDHALRALVLSKYSRQSVIIYNRPSMHIEHDDGINANHDFICTMYTHQFIDEQEKLQMYVYMRSNDVIFGLQNDYSWQRYVYFQMLEKLRQFFPIVNIGNIHWSNGSSHIYQRHFELLKDIIREYNNENI